MATLWQRMGEAFGAAWVNQYGRVGESAFQTWVIALRDLTPQQIKYGFTKVMKRKDRYPPSMNEFRALCMPSAEDFGLPDLRAAYTEACRKSSSPSRFPWSHPAVYLAGSSTGWFELRNFAESKTWPLFQRNYEIAVRRVMNGEDLSSVIPKALPPESQVPKRTVSKAEGHRRMQELIASVKGVRA